MILEKILNLLNVKINETKYEILICRHCNKEVAKTMFCGNCGEYLLHCEKTSDYFEFESIECRHCKEMIPINKFCGNCGEKIIL